jgi:tRNA pseudouridine55 synthase
MAEGFLLVDKPAGITSHGVVARIRKALGVRRVGHAGTLDPMATGLLVCAVGRATRLVRYVQELEKEYLAVARFGVATDTLDADGAVVHREPMEVEPAEVEEVARRFVGRILQVPPMTSALKMEGRRLYELAREGVEVERAAREVTIRELEILEVTPSPYPEVEFRVVCGKGTYVRVLADDLARSLGGRAHLVALRRTRIGSLRVEEAVPLEPDRLKEAILTPAEALRDLPSVVAPEETVRAAAHGMRFATGPAEGLEEGRRFRLLDSDGRLVAVYRVKGRGSVPEVVLG